MPNHQEEVAVGNGSGHLVESGGHVWWNHPVVVAMKHQGRDGKVGDPLELLEPRNQVRLEDRGDDVCEAAHPDRGRQHPAARFTLISGP
eukprot:1870164-Rhodomonas_salina.1